MHYTGINEGAFEKRMAYVDGKEKELDTNEYWDIYSLIEDNGEEIDKMNMKELTNALVKLTQWLANVTTEMSYRTELIEERMRLMDENLWQLKDFFAQSHAPLEVRERPDCE
jgi:hypothetical protein